MIAISSWRTRNLLIGKLRIQIVDKQKDSQACKIGVKSKGYCRTSKKSQLKSSRRWRNPVYIW